MAFHWVPFSLASGSPQSIVEYFSTFYRMVPYIRYDRPPRTMMASMQAIQGVCYPWTAGSSAYTPVYSDMPLYITHFTVEMLAEAYGTCQAACLGKLMAPSNILPG